MKKDLDGRSVLIAIPAYDGKVHVETMGSVIEAGIIVRELGATWGVTYLCGMPIITKARNALVHSFLSTECTDVLFLDADISFDPSALAAGMMENKDVIGIAYRLKDDEVRYKLHLQENPDGSLIRDGNLLKADRFGTGWMLVQRRVLERLSATAKKYTFEDIEYSVVFDTVISDGEFLGEDYYFCDKARAIGFSLFINPFVNITHHGDKSYEGVFAEDALGIPETEAA